MISRAGNEKIGDKLLVLPVAAGAVLEQATMAVLNADGYAEPAKKAEGLLIAGCVQRHADNVKGIAAATTVIVGRGTFVWDNDGTIKETDILKKCYIADEHTVSITETGSSAAGIILAVEDNGVIVDMKAV